MSAGSSDRYQFWLGVRFKISFIYIANIDRKAFLGFRLVYLIRLICVNMCMWNRKYTNVMICLFAVYGQWE